MKNIKLSNKELCEKYPFLLPYHAISQQDSLELRTDYALFRKTSKES